MMATPASSASSSLPSPLPALALIVLVSSSLHLVPQWLAPWLDPAWTMTVLMLLDALVVGWLLRSLGALRLAAGLLALFALLLLTRQSSVVALPAALFNLTVAVVFGATLLPGQMPLIERIARHAFPDGVTPPFARYLRGLTLVWSLFFVALAVTAIALALLAPFVVWSLFVNVLTWPLIGSMFVLEWVIRRLFFRDLPAHTPLQTLASTLAFRPQFSARSRRP